MTVVLCSKIAGVWIIMFAQDNNVRLSVNKSTSHAIEKSCQGGNVAFFSKNDRNGLNWLLSNLTASFREN